jgi:hypothetical protein
MMPGPRSTLALDDGADAAIIERLTHPPKSRSAFQLYIRGKNGKRRAVK